jgi:lysophospholipase L1-like esterase
MGKLGGLGTSLVLAAGVGLAIGLDPTGSVARASSAPTVSVYPLGDSITFGLSGPDASTPGGYRGYLASDLSQVQVQVAYQGTSTANPPVSTDLNSFRHDGHSGFRIDQVETDLQSSDPSSGSDGGYWMTGGSGHSAIHPDVVVLLIGTNDILQAFDPGRHYPGGYQGTSEAERDQFVSDMTQRLWSLLAELEHLDPGLRLVLCTIPPLGLQTRDPTVAAYDQALRDRVVPTAHLFGMRVQLADIEGAFLSQPSDQPDLMGPDGIHPSPLGYSRMAGVIANSLVQVERAR